LGAAARYPGRAAFNQCDLRQGDTS
jgi:hypothetical protein